MKIDPTPTGARLWIAARPGAPRSELREVVGDQLKIALAAPPEKGKANKELIRLLAQTLGLRKADVALTSGATSRNKIVEIQGLTPDQIRARLPL